MRRGRLRPRGAGRETRCRSRFVCTRWRGGRPATQRSTSVTTSKPVAPVWGAAGRSPRRGTECAWVASVSTGPRMPLRRDTARRANPNAGKPGLSCAWIGLDLNWIWISPAGDRGDGAERIERRGVGVGAVATHHATHPLPSGASAGTMTTAGVGARRGRGRGGFSRGRSTGTVASKPRRRRRRRRFICASPGTPRGGG